MRDQVDIVRAFLFRNRVVICGTGDMGTALVRAYRAEGRSVVAIDHDAANPLLRTCREAGAVVFVGDATEPMMLVHAGVHRADEVVVTCGDDAVNAKVANEVSRIAAPRSSRGRVCAQHVVDPYLWRDLVRQDRANEAGPRRVFFNLYDSGARAMLAQYPFPSRTALRPRLVIVGLGHLGESLAMRAARRWRHRRASDTDALTITVVDREATRKCELLKLHFPGVGSVANLEPIDCDVRSPGFESFEFLMQGDSDEVAAFVCMDDDTLSLTTARLLRQSGTPATDVIVRIQQTNGLVELFQQAGESSTGDLRVFSLLEAACTPEVVHGGASVETLAQLIHEAYVDQQRSIGRGDGVNPSTVDWSDLTDDLRESNRDQARHVPRKLASIDRWFVATPQWEIENDSLKPDEVEKLAIMEHNRFVQERLRQGWTQGPVRDPAKKINPFLVSWDELPPPDENGVDVRDYDRESVRRLPEFLAQAGFSVRRL